MSVRIFELTPAKQVILTEHALHLPEVQSIIDTYPEEHMSILKYCYYMTVPDSPYSNLGAEEKEKMIIEDVGGDFSLDEECIHNCVEKLKKLYETRTTRLYNAVAKSIDNMATYLESATPEAGKDGNLAEIRQYQQNIGKIYDSFKKVEKSVEEEFTVKLRGKGKRGMY